MNFRKATSLVLSIALFCILTLITQIGGLLYLLFLLSARWITIRGNYPVLTRIVLFTAFYLGVSLLIVPQFARLFGREPLPLYSTRHLRPQNMLTCLLNRHYVRPEMRALALHVAEEMNARYPGTELNYLDANFPFADGFPLLPHRSHSDGKKLDVSFCYDDAKTGAPVNDVPSPIGYGVCEGPTAEELNATEACEKKGYWQYGLLETLIPQGRKQSFRFDAAKTRDLANFFAEDERTGKIFIEPHLKQRLGLENPKVRFQGCAAVRHDDHLHVQIR